MVTMAQAIRSILEEAGGRATSEEIRAAINARYPGEWEPSTLQAHLYACRINNPKAYIHHPSSNRFRYRTDDGDFELYSEERHGPNIWAPTGESELEIEELAETSISLEKDIEEHLLKNLGAIEKGLTLVKQQYVTDVGRIDILARDSKGIHVVIEIKVGEAKDSAIGQIARYLGWLSKNHGKQVRGIIVAADFSEGVRYAAEAIPNLELLSYKVHFSFEPVST